MSTPGARPLREMAVQMLASVMIPLTVAGTGLYYTSWQQNLNDLKTMIELVSDQSPEKRKYGIAMFEYLLKNDKVPVEFVSAQLDYANSSQDKDLLPLMETALQKVAITNPKVADVYREALERLPTRLFIHVMNDEQRQCWRTMMGALKDYDRAKITVPGIARAVWAGKQHELRIFRKSDLDRGGQLITAFTAVGFPVALADLSAAWEGDARIKPNTMELWFGKAELPKACIDGFSKAKEPEAPAEDHASTAQ
jgi:hypothetical protein